MAQPLPPVAPRRRFTIGDGLLITIAVAGACLAARTNLANTVAACRRLDVMMLVAPNAWVEPWPNSPAQQSPLGSTNLMMMASVQGTAGISTSLIRYWPPTRGQALAALRQCVVFLFPIVAYLSFALPLLRLVRPRPAWGPLLAQPGWSACLAAGLALPAATWTEQITHESISVSYVAAAVGLGWLVQALARRWRPEPSWVDRTGRALGACWLVIGLIALA